MGYEIPRKIATMIRRLGEQTWGFTNTSRVRRRNNWRLFGIRREQWWHDGMTACRQCKCPKKDHFWHFVEIREMKSCSTFHSSLHICKHSKHSRRISNQTYFVQSSNPPTIHSSLSQPLSLRLSATSSSRPSSPHFRYHLSFRNVYFRLKFHPSIKLDFPPVGWHNTVEQPPQIISLGTCQKMVMTVKQQGPLTSIKKRTGTSH